MVNSQLSPKSTKAPFNIFSISSSKEGAADAKQKLAIFSLAGLKEHSFKRTKHTASESLNSASDHSASKSQKREDLLAETDEVPEWFTGLVNKKADTTAEDSLWSRMER